MRRLLAYPAPFLALLLAASAALAEPSPEVVKVLSEAKMGAADIYGQSVALARLAWPDEGSRNPEVSAAARAELVAFGSRGLAAMRLRLPRAPIRYRGDITAAFIATRYRNPTGMPPEYLPGLEEAIWFGNIEAQRLAMIEMARYRFPPAVLTTIDAARAHPTIAHIAIETLGQIGDDRARFYLEEVLTKGPDENRAAAARALAKIGNRAASPLRAALRSEDQGVRTSAMEAFLPVSSVNEIAALKLFVTRFPEDDPELLDRVRSRTAELEALLDREGTLFGN